MKINRQKFSILFFSLIVGCFVVAGQVSAFTASTDLFGGEEANITANIGLTDTSPQVIAARIINVSLGFVGIIFLGLLVYAGFIWMTSAGDPTKIEKAKKTMVAAVIGMIITLSSWGIAKYIVNQLSSSIGPGSASCIVGDTQACGCGGTGVSTCIAANGIWSACTVLPCVTPAVGSSCDGIPAGACDPDPTLCGSLNCYNNPLNPADPLNCTCQPGGALGANCNASSTPSPGFCDPLPVMCASDLNCNPLDCTCTGAPIIDWFSPVNGSNEPVGTSTNLMTIGGRYFGTTTGEVYFSDSGGSTTILALSPSMINSQCSDNWKDNQVIVVIPEGAEDGPVRLVRGTPDHLEDITDDSRGINTDFKVENVVRPGLCLVANQNASSTACSSTTTSAFGTSCGYFQDRFRTQGVHFMGLNREVMFGGSIASSAAESPSWLSSTTVDAYVPDLKPANTRVFIINDGVLSNALNFSIDYDLDKRPRIDYIDPPQGPISKYITIFGSNFGNKAGTVEFYDIGGADAGNNPNADISFPKGCDDYWHDTYIIVKVPSGISSSTQVKVNTALPASLESDPADFMVTTGNPGPGICKITPHNGDVNQVVNAIGERFGTVAGSAVFYDSQTTSTLAWTDKSATTTVSEGAVTGPFYLVDAALFKSNSLNFTVGKCTANSDCESGEECCGSGSFEGICRTSGTCGATGAPASCMFAWDLFTYTPVIASTCAGMANAEQCSASYTCPNSPGQCQSTVVGVVSTCGATYCNATSSPYSAACDGFNMINSVTNGCVYNSVKNRCEIDPLAFPVEAVCDVASSSFMGTGLAGNCRKVNGDFVWQVNTPASCPSGFFRDTNGQCTLGSLGAPTTCSVCSGGFSCDAGRCVDNKEVCPTGSTCNATDECVSTDDTCECCCRIGQSEQDCCPGLTCAGTCGADIVDDGVGFGMCTGCRVDGVTAGTTTAQEIALSNQACNCTGDNTRICLFDLTDPTDLGACVDNLVLDECDGDAGATPGGGANCVAPQDALCGIADPAKTWCDPLSCTCKAPIVPPVTCDGNPAMPACQASDPICALADPLNPICNPITCLCESNIGAGQLCLDGTPACTTGVPACGADYTCLNDGAFPTPTDCRCCCDPGDGTMANPPDQKTLIDGTILLCQSDKTPCSGDARGLFCGCTNDGQCGVVNGCGIDTCCRPRPSVSTTTPASGQTDVCRNPLIQVKFNQPMDIGSFSGNVILAGNYGGAPCPSNTTYLTTIQLHESFLARIWRNVKSVLAGQAIAAPMINYCAVLGSADGYNDAATGNGVLRFATQKILDPNKEYTVILKGDSSSTDSVKEGIMNTYNVGMDASTTEEFNGVNYYGHIWKFTTKLDNTSSGGDSGICKFDKIILDPESYTFTKATPTTTVATTTFIAEAATNAGSLVVPVAGYDWNWQWTIDDSTVVSIPAIATGSSVVVTSGTKKDARTYLNITSRITTDTLNTPSTKNQLRVNRALIRMFWCASPWPPMINPALWPWQDSGTNCNVAGAPGCETYNFEFYYCRDGQTTNAPNLPSLENNNAIIRGTSTNPSSMQILKEMFFLRATSTISAAIAATNDASAPAGGRIVVSWPWINLAGGYKLYYGTQSGKYTKYIDVPQTAGPTISYPVAGLKNGTKYYFAVKVYRSDNGAESDFSAEVSETPKDMVAPAAPLSLNIISDNPGATIMSWSKNKGDTVKYKIYLTHNKMVAAVPPLGGQVMDAGNTDRITLAGLNSSILYYVTVTALDAAGNESINPGVVAVVNKTPKALADITAIKDALAAYALVNGGAYPVSTGWQGYCSSWGADIQLPVWIAGLAPYFPTGMPRDPSLLSGYVCDGVAAANAPTVVAKIESRAYIYYSNGTDYKLLVHHPESMKVDSALIDPQRPTWAYGYWTPGAVNW